MNSNARPGKVHERRTFLCKSIALLGSAFALSIPMQSKAQAEKVESFDKPDKPSKGYQETAHVRTYYEKARF